MQKNLFAILTASLVAIFFGAANAAESSKPYNWTMVYAGVNGGYGWGSNTNPTITFIDPGAFVGFGAYFATGGNKFPNLRPQGFLAGGQIGADKQWQHFVVGAVVDFQGSNIKASGNQSVNPPGFFYTEQSLSQNLDFLGTLRGRLGLAFNNWLFYGTGGMAYGQVNSTINFNLPGVLIMTGSNKQTLTGWAAGLGVNYAWRNLVLGIEYLSYNLGNSTVTTLPNSAAPDSSLTATQSVAGNTVRGIINYKFNW